MHPSPITANVRTVPNHSRSGWLVSNAEHLVSRSLVHMNGGCVVYFQFTHRLGRSHYVWDEYDDERKGEGKTRCRPIAFSSRKTPRGPPGLTFPSDGRIAINSTICLLNICTPVIYNLAIINWTFPPLPQYKNLYLCSYTVPLRAPRLKIFK